MEPGINVFNFLSSERFLRLFVNETQSGNMLYQEVLGCYLLLASEMGWVDVYDKLIDLHNKSSETQDILKSAVKHLNAVRNCHRYAHLAN